MNYIHMFLVFYTGFGSRTSSQLLYHLQVWETRKRVKKTSQAVLDSSAHRIFKLRPGSLLLSRLHTIVAVMMLNFRVRDGNGWTLALISTNFYCNCSRSNKLLTCLPTLLSPQKSSAFLGW